MIGIVSLLTDEAYLQVRQAQICLAAKHGLDKATIFPPHVTYVIGNSRDYPEWLLERLGLLASQIDPFTIHSSGLGLFIAPSPVLYLPVPRSPDLAARHQLLHALFQDLGEGILPYYQPDAWLPHITLVSQKWDPARLPVILDDLGSVSGNMNIWLRSLFLAQELAPERWEITHEFPFRGQNELPLNPFALQSRPCQVSDRDFIYQLVKETLKPVVSAFYPWDESVFDENFSKSWQERVVILHQGRPAGYIGYDAAPTDHFYISGLFLKPAFQGRGWGKWLLNFMESLAQGQPLRLHVWKNNPALTFYQRHGYRIISSEGPRLLLGKESAISAS